MMKKPISKWAAFMSVMAALSGCNTPSDAPLTTDAVKDEATAIRIGQKACVASWLLARARQEGGWHAELHQGVWDVWQQARACRLVETKVIAASGQSDGSCSVCVT
jgi:hypothetical protein